MHVRAFLDHSIRFSTLALCALGTLLALVWMALAGPGPWSTALMLLCAVLVWCACKTLGNCSMPQKLLPPNSVRKAIA